MLRGLICGSFLWLVACSPAVTAPRVLALHGIEEASSSEGGRVAAEQRRAESKPVVFDTEAVCESGALEGVLARVCAAPGGPDVPLCRVLEDQASMAELGDAALDAGRPRLAMALTERWLRAGRRFDQRDLRPLFMATFDVAAVGVCIENTRNILTRLYGSYCDAGIGVLRRPERSGMCVALMRTSCSILERQAVALRTDDPGRAGELYRRLSQGSCSPTAEQAWNYGLRARRAFDAAHRYQDAQRIDESLAARPRPLPFFPQAPPWQWRRQRRY